MHKGGAFHWVIDQQPAWSVQRCMTGLSPLLGGRHKRKLSESGDVEIFGGRERPWDF